MADFAYTMTMSTHSTLGFPAMYIDLFNKCAGKLDDATKVQLLLGKLSPPDHERYKSYILPKLVPRSVVPQSLYLLADHEAGVDFKLLELTELSRKLKFKCALLTNSTNRQQGV